VLASGSSWNSNPESPKTFKHILTNLIMNRCLAKLGLVIFFGLMLSSHTVSSVAAESSVNNQQAGDHPIKVMFFMKRANGLTLEQFRDWWFKVHMPDIKRRHGPYLVGYRTNVRSELEDSFAGKPRQDPEWDGVAELWYRNGDALNEAYSGTLAQASRADTLAHVSKLQRLIVDQSTVIAPPAQ
jgi:hypothetical protein